VANGGTVEIDVVSNDTDADGDTLTIDSVIPGANGTAAITAGGVTYTHDGSATTSDSFTYTVSDGNGGTATGTVTLTIEAAPYAVFVTKWGTYGRGDMQLKWPLSVAVAPDGSVYVADYNNHRIQKFKSAGDGMVLDHTWGKKNAAGQGVSGNGNEEFNRPWDVAVAPDGSFYVADVFNHRIQVFNSGGDWVENWGKQNAAGTPTWGSGNKQFRKPKGVAVAPDGSVYVADTNSHRIQVFNSGGDWVENWGKKNAAGQGVSGNGNEEFNAPLRVAVAPDGSVYVADTNNHRIQVFNSGGDWVENWGKQNAAGNGVLGSGDKQFNKPAGVAVAPDGSVYVADFENNRIQKFDSDGNFLFKWGEQGQGEGEFEGPRGVAVAPDGSFYVADQKNDRIQKFSVGP
jgi:glucose/arabinose dehydrogenase